MEMLDLNIELQNSKISNKFIILDDILDKSTILIILYLVKIIHKIIENLNKLSKTQVKVSSKFFLFQKILQISKKKQKNKKKNY